jgi:protein TonB
MNKDLIMKSDVLDILFENRNKAYGAYDLRKFYADRLKKGLGIMMIVASGFAVFTFLPKKSNIVTARIFEFPDTKLPTVKKEIKEPEKKQEAAKPAVKTTPVTQKPFLNNLVIVDNKDKSDLMPTLNETDVISNTAVITTGSGPVIVQPANTGNGNPTEAGPPKIDKTNPMNLESVDVPPSYPGGIEALRKFLEKNLNNPKDMEEGESVNVKIRFVVGYNGKLQSFVTVEDGGEEFNGEVVRVLKKMPQWIPGKANGENVSVYYTIPVKFVPAD